MIISPTEPDELKALGTVSWAPEQYGADVFFLGAELRKVGVQRKEYKDFIASVNDGRLVKEIMQMTAALDYKLLIIEGVIQWTTDGKLILPFQGSATWTKHQWTGLLLSLMDRGVFVLHTESLSDTCSLLPILESWFKKSSHSSLATRPGSGGGLWGQGINDREFASWLMQGIPNVGHKLAERIYDEYGLPFKLTVGVDELMKIEGIGKVKAEQIVRLFNHDDAAAT